MQDYHELYCNEAWQLTADPTLHKFALQDCQILCSESWQSSTQVLLQSQYITVLPQALKEMWFGFQTFSDGSTLHKKVIFLRNSANRKNSFTTFTDSLLFLPARKDIKLCSATDVCTYEKADVACIPACIQAAFTSQQGHILEPNVQ